MPLYGPVIIQDVRPELVDAPLMPIYMMRHRACGLPFSLLSQPILLLWKDASLQPGDCWIDMTINDWCSVDAHLWAHLRDILTVIGCSTVVQKIHTASIGSRYTGSMKYDLNPRSSRNLSFWASTIHIICMSNDVAPLRVNTFGR
jgi:hypothetical protein